MYYWGKVSVLAVAVSMLGTSTFAQNTDKNKNKKEKTQEIIIRKNSEKDEKITIVVDGNKVTVNGKPVDELKGDDISVRIRDGLALAPGARAFALPGGGDWGDFDSWSSGGNKAFLGVVSEKADDGVKVTDVSEGSAAEKAGLKEGDIITKVDAKKIESHSDLVDALSEKKPNDKVEIMYKRDGKESKITATLGENKRKAYSFNFNNDDFKFNMPEVPGVPRVQGFSYSSRPKVGMQIQDVEEGSGVKVKDVDDDSPAAKAGMKEDDIITQVNGKAVNGVIELRDAIKDLKEGDTFKVTYKRGNKTETAEIKFPKKLRTVNL